MSQHDITKDTTYMGKHAALVSVKDTIGGRNVGQRHEFWERKTLLMGNLSLFVRGQ